MYKINLPDEWVKRVRNSTNVSLLCTEMDGIARILERDKAYPFRSEFEILTLKKKYVTLRYKIQTLLEEKIKGVGA